MTDLGMRVVGSDGKERPLRAGDLPPAMQDLLDALTAFQQGGGIVSGLVAGSNEGPLMTIGGDYRGEGGFLLKIVQAVALVSRELSFGLIGSLPAASTAVSRAINTLRELQDAVHMTILEDLEQAERESEEAQRKAKVEEMEALVARFVVEDVTDDAFDGFQADTVPLPGGGVLLRARSREQD
jgi:hypothetical protein